MIAKTTFALAAVLLAGSTLAASADTMIHDSNTGLEARYYYDTLANLERQGLPISDRARTYLNQHGGNATVAGKRRNVYMLEDRPVYGAAPSYAPYNTPSDDKQRPW
jgi:hypothetical protein